MNDFLDDQQLKNYRNCGFYFPIEVMSASEAREHYQKLNTIEARHGPMHYRVKPYLIFRSASDIATNPRLLDAVESILGPDILLWDCSYVIKEPRSDGYVSWHQDLTYWGLEMETDYDLVSAWVALTPVTKSNGCMQFVRGSHKAGKLAHRDTYDEKNILHRGQSIGGDFDEDMIMQIELSPGQASLHQGWAVHSSNPNTSDMRRVGLVLNYLKPSVRQIVGASESATLVRGWDDNGHFETEPPCVIDFAAENVAYQLEVERKKREVYDTA